MLDTMLDEIQRRAFAYFAYETNLHNGLVIDTTTAGAPSSIAAVGLGLTAYPAAVERGFISRAEAAAHALATFRFFWHSTQGPEPDATGFHGLHSHLLDMHTGARMWECDTWDCELSRVDSALLIAGMPAAAADFDGNGETERKVRDLAERLYARVDWCWALNGGLTLTHGWKPATGFLPYRWQGYDEAMLLYVLALGSPTHPIAPASYDAWATTYEWRTVHGTSYLHAGPLFIHQLSHVWVDFSGIRDAYMRGHGSDYFENSRRATEVQQQYATRISHGYSGYGETGWGITASNGPGNVTREIAGIPRRFFDYLARGVPDGPDDGTIAPWAVVAPVRAGDRRPHHRTHVATPTRQWPSVRVQDHLQPDVFRFPRLRAGVGVTIPLRPASGAGRSTDRALPLGVDLESAPFESPHHGRTACRRIHRWGGSPTETAMCHMLGPTNVRVGSPHAPASATLRQEMPCPCSSVHCFQRC